MTKRTNVFAFALLTAGTVLLTACSQPSPAAGNEKSAPVPVSTTSSPAGSESSGGEAGGSTEPVDQELQPVECGPVEVDGLGTQTLVAQPALAGIVGCTEAFNVIDEYLKIPSAQRSANFEGTPLSAGWTCSTDDGETASIGCVKGKNGDDWDFAFSTKPV